jgi:CheY-like chemotaxis protein
LRQEFTSPAAALAEYARELAAKVATAGDAGTSRTADRIRDRAEHLLETVRNLTAPDAQTDPADPAQWRGARHDLRAAVAYVIMACEDIAEGAPHAVAAALGPELARTTTAARRVVELIEAMVRFNLTADAPPPQAAAIQEMLNRLPRAVAPSAGGVTGRVLVVDDNEFGRDLIVRMLAQQGHTVEVAASGVAAQERLGNAGQPAVDLILLDVMMPEMTGPELLRWLKADSRFWHVPVIMVSALGEDDSVLACIAAGAEDYLTRPVRPELLRARLTGSLEKKRLRDRETEYQARIAELVRAIFPPAVVDEWERTGTIRPRHYERVGVLFLDIVGFTALCEQFHDRPEEVVRLLQQQVVKFEATVARHGVQKVKTIGDGFLGLTGLAEPDPNPALTLLKCGLDLIADTIGQPAGWQVRVGVHVGPVVTGVLGKTQFSFDVWGHTVNVASRVEGHGRPNRVTLSDDAWRCVADVADGEERQVVARGIGVMTVWDFVRWKAAG